MMPLPLSNLVVGVCVCLFFTYFEFLERDFCWREYNSNFKVALFHSHRWKIKEEAFPSTIQTAASG